MLLSKKQFFSLTMTQKWPHLWIGTTWAWCTPGGRWWCWLQAWPVVVVRQEVVEEALGIGVASHRAVDALYTRIEVEEREDGGFCWVCIYVFSAKAVYFVLHMWYYKMWDWQTILLGKPPNDTNSCNEDSLTSLVQFSNSTIAQHITYL